MPPVGSVHDINLSVHSTSLMSKVVGSKDAEGRRSSSPRESPPPPQLIAETKQTQVFKTTEEGAIIAIKKYRNPTEQSAKTWRREINIMNLFDHPSITKLLHYNAENLSLKLEYVGPDLSKFIGEDRMSQLSENQAYQIWIDVSRGLEYIHKRQILHLDLRPQNILLGENGRAKICDFGLSTCSMEPVIHDGGSPRYLPPEYIRTYKKGRPADVRALGVTMLFVFGLEPLPPKGGWKIASIENDKTARRKMSEWLDQVKQRTKQVPKELFLLREMLVEDPNDRIKSSKLVRGLRATSQVQALTSERLS
ncbi:hypothetical protein B7494_g7682 [Chlorociboria aeruginascens]|nr:hypothetical protein B7494_g7682 [Chlorociboria aeruginascens]